MRGCFVVETRPQTGPVDATAVLLLPPLGYEETASYRPLRVLADHLAADGRLVVRLDWPGLGDSALDPLDDARGPETQAIVGVLIADLRARGFDRVAGVGLRVGGLLAANAGGFDALVLWGVPPTGRRYLREERAFQRLSAKAFGAAPDDAPPLPDGAREAGGFVYPAGLVEVLGELDLAAALTASPPAQLLLLPREGTEPTPAVLEAAKAAGVAVTVDAAGGLGDLLDDPYRARLAEGSVVAIRGWLGPPTPSLSPTPGAGVPTLALPGGAEERPWVEPGGAGALSGVICVPAGGLQPGMPWTLFFNAGGVRRSGPNQLWTQSARALAAQGRASLRLDVRDVGDSDGVAQPHDDLDEMYAETAIDDAVQAFDAARAAGAGDIDVVGLCSGAFLGMQVAARRPVRRAVLFNGLSFIWDDEARAKGMTAHIRGSLFDARRWRRLLTGRIDARALTRAMASDARLRLESTAARLRGEAPPSPVDRLVQGVRSRGTDLCLVSSAGDPSLPYLERHVPPDRRPQVVVLTGADHTIRPAWAHPRVLALIAAAPEP